MRIAGITSKAGHHSVFEHSHVTILVYGIPKLLAMTLNSHNNYVTSEKSARYTVMKPNTELENELYNKWLNIFMDIIPIAYPSTKLDIGKIAQENARYMLSVYTPTSMVYTVNYRQLCYIIEWLECLAIKAKEADGFYSELSESAEELKEKLIELIGGTEYLLKPKSQPEFEFFESLRQHKLDDVREAIGDAYTIKYKASIACLAQLQRHRTLSYGMFFDSDNDKNPTFYTPKLLRYTENLKDDWNKDLNRLYKAGVYPQALEVGIVESGTISKFILKSRERLCARAQLEIMESTIESAKKLHNFRDNMSKHNQEQLNKWFDSTGNIKLKCRLHKCLEPCVWGGIEGVARLI